MRSNCFWYALSKFISLRRYALLKFLIGYARDTGVFVHFYVYDCSFDCTYSYVPLRKHCLLRQVLPYRGRICRYDGDYYSVDKYDNDCVVKSIVLCRKY